MAHPTIFISYRVADAKREAELLFTHLVNEFGNDAPFLDKKRLQPGANWSQELEQNVRRARVLLVLIKDLDAWLGVQKGVRRTQKPDDWVRKEIEIALEAGKKIVPLLFEKGEMPPLEAIDSEIWRKHEFQKLQAVQIGDGRLDDLLPRIFEAIESAGVPRRPLPADQQRDLLADYPLPAGFPLPTAAGFDSPYLGLRYFERGAARLFFGRKPELLAFFSRIEDPDTRLLCLFGRSGVGKSSLLAAGVLPRLERFCRVFYFRRDKTEGLHKQLFQKIETAKTADQPPPVFILDQVEEMFTDPISNEKENLVAVLGRALADLPTAKFVFGFRSDFQLEVCDLLRRTDERLHELPIFPLEKTALAEAIEGAQLDAELRDAYQIDLEKNFAEQVALDIFQNESGSDVGSILQNRLLHLFLEAKKRRTPAQPRALLRIEDYRELKKNSRAEEELLDFQLDRLRRECPDLPADEPTVVRALHQFVIDKPTAGTLPKSELPDDQQPLREGLRRVNLLAEMPDGEAVRLSHDLLAPVVRRRHELLLVYERDASRASLFERLVGDLRADTPKLHFKKAARDLDQAAELALAAEHTIWAAELWEPAFELAFVHLQAGKRPAGAAALRRCRELIARCRAAVGELTPAPTGGDAFFENAPLPELLYFLKRLEPRFFQKMEARYFPTMVFVPGGEFEMGDVLGDKEYVNETVHRVGLDDFWLADTPTTWQQYGLFCLSENRELPKDEGWGRANRPIINVSWYDAVEFANWLSRLRGRATAFEIDKNLKDPNNQNEDNYDKLKWTVRCNWKTGGFRLPTESEWEFAAREGGRAVRFGNGKMIADPLGMNFDASEKWKKPYSVVGEYRQKTTPVRSFLPNSLGLYDMAGNVWDWCWDWYGDSPNKFSKNPQGAEQGTARVIRGGSWYRDAQYCRAAYRGNSSPEGAWSSDGFRLALSLQSVG